MRYTRFRRLGPGASLTHVVKALADWSLEHRDAIDQGRRGYDDEQAYSEIR